MRHVLLNEVNVLLHQLVLVISRPSQELQDNKMQDPRHRIRTQDAAAFGTVVPLATPFPPPKKTRKIWAHPHQT